jgi:transposase
LNGVRSSRRLAREAQRNIEVQWLIERLMPAFKTIADFRKDHASAIGGVCRSFVKFCREQALYGGELLALDGSKIEAVASRKRVVTTKGLEERAAALDGEIVSYLARMDAADREEEGSETASCGDVQAALEALREQREAVGREAERLAGEGLSQLVTSEPEAKLMRTARHGRQVAYNAQIVADARHKLIVAFDLSGDGNDFGQLHTMAVAGKRALGLESVTVVADSGYSNGEQARLCQEDAITAIAPRPQTVNPHGKQYFSRDAFSYDKASDSWRCPAGEVLVVRDISRTEKKKRYTTKACSGCVLKPRCTKAAQRVVVRDLYEDDREAMHQRAMSDPRWMTQRRCIVEHPFGTMKAMMGSPRFLLRGLDKAKAELALAVLAYNLKRVINILGVPQLLATLQPQHP